MNRGNEGSHVVELVIISNILPIEIMTMTTRLIGYSLMNQPSKNLDSYVYMPKVNNCVSLCLVHACNQSESNLYVSFPIDKNFCFLFPTQLTLLYPMREFSA